MKTLCAGLVMVSVVVVSGCTSASTGTSEKHPGGPGVSTNASQKEPLVGTGENEFKLSPPYTATHLKQGESKEVKISIDRGKNFSEDVTLKFEGSPDMPKGVTFDPSSPTIKHGDKEAVFTVKAAEDAAVGDFKIKVTAKPSKGKEAADTFEIKIAKKG